MTEEVISPDARHAIAILEKMQRKLPAAQLAYWVLPNTVLTLAGVRPYCDGVYWDDDGTGKLETWQNEIKESVAVLRDCTEIIWSQAGIEQARPGESYAGFDVIMAAGLRYEIEQTTLLQAVTHEQLLEAGTAAAMRRLLVDDVSGQARFKEISPENIDHIVAGILLGYPDQAIVSSVGLWDADDPFAEPLMDADIRGARFYICPEPRYMYPRHLVSDPAIVAHEKLWSGILRDFYESDFHKRLAADAKFQAKMRELGNLR